MKPLMQLLSIGQSRELIVLSQLLPDMMMAAKQLITLGGALQGLYFAAFTFGKLNEKLPIFWALPLFIPVVLVIYFSAQCVCQVYLTPDSMRAYQLLLQGRCSPMDIHELNEAVKSWCYDIDSITNKKTDVVTSS